MRLEPFPFRWNRNGGSSSLFDAFSSREPVSTSLENALAYRAAKDLQIGETPLRGICRRRPAAHAGPAGALADLGACHGSGFSSSCGARKRPHPVPGGSVERNGRGSKTGNAVAESENIVVETAERIFGDLADAQTINRDSKGGWKAPLWQALTEAGLPLSWVPEDCGGSGASMAEGFSVLSAAGRFAIAVPLAGTMVGGWG